MESPMDAGVLIGGTPLLRVNDQQYSWPCWPSNDMNSLAPPCKWECVESIVNIMDMGNIRLHLT